MLLVFAPLVLMFAIAYYNSATSVKKPYQVFRDRYYGQGLLEKHQSQVPVSRISKGRVLLQKDVKVFGNRTCMVYRGFSDGVILMDLVMLELDPDMVYPVRLNKELFKSGYLIGDSIYRLEKVKRNRLVLVVESTY